MKRKYLPLLLIFNAYCICVYGRTDLTQKRVTIHLENVSLKRVFHDLRKQTKLVFFYNNDVLNDQEKVSVSSNNESLDVLLKKILRPRGIGFRQDNSYIILFKADNPNMADRIIPMPSKPAQPDTLQSFTGKVVRSADGTAIVGATITNQANNTATVSDEQGNFTVRAVIGDLIQIGLIGHNLVTVKASQSALAVIPLTERVAALDEVIVTGYTSQAKREITGAISSIRADEVSGAMATSLDGAMQGRMSGVNVQSQVGVPGAGIRVRVRGAGSISAGNDPLYVLDGIVINTTATSNTVSTNPLATINPDDILSIEVLKDAAAASVYGAQAANGVVLITTKKGSVGKPNLNFGYRRGYASPVRLMDVLSSQEYLNARFEAVRNSNPTWTEARVRENVLGASQLPITLTDADIAQLQTYDWQDASYRTGVSSKYDLSVAGGTDKSRYRISVGYEDTEGSIIGSDFIRGTANLSYTNNLTDQIELSSTVNLSTIKQQGPLGSLGTTTQFSAPSYASPMMLPFVPIYSEDGELHVDYGGFPGTFKNNIVHSTLHNEHIERSNGLLANLQFGYQILKNLHYRTVVGLDYRDGNARNFLDPRTSDGYNAKGILQEYSNKPVTFTNSHVLTFSPYLDGEHNLKALGGFEYYSYSRQSSSTRGEGFPTFEFSQMQSAALITSALGSWTGFRRVGSFVQANYTYGSRFMVSGIVRYDGSSRFGVNNRFGVFPAISAGWDMAQEHFMQRDWLDQLKLRIGYGETGNDQIGNFASRSLYGGGVTYDGASGIRANSLGNADLKWERNATANIGLDFALWNETLHGTFELYNRRSKDLLLSKPVVWAGGYDEIVQNLGEMTNKGIELELGAKVIKDKSFQWRSGFNITFQKNRVEKLYDGMQVLPGDESVRVGYSLLTHVLPQYAGVNPATGKAVWYDTQGNLTYNPSTMTGDSYAPYGFPNGMPSSFGGFDNQFSYKGLTLGVFFQYDFGRVLYNNMGRTLGRKGDAQINGMQWYYDNRWQQPGQMTTVPRSINNAAERGSARGDLASSRYLEDASYVRLKNISLSYAIPAQLLANIRLQSAELTLQANNLYTWTEFTGYDPEFTTANTGVIPTMKSFFVSLQIGL